MRRTFVDDDLLEWEAYVTGGQPATELAARVFFVCLSDPYERPRWVVHESGDVAAAERDLGELSDERLKTMLADARLLE